MRIQASSISLFLALLSAAALSACAPQVTGGDGKASQASESAGGDDGDGDNPPPKDGDPHGGGCEGDPDQATCEVLLIGDQATCQSAGDIKAAGVDACAAAGLLAVDVSPGWDCPDGGSTIAKVLCCDSGAPAGDPVPPQGGPDPAGGFGDGVTCVPNSDYLAMAQAACAEIGMILMDLYTTDDCSASESRYAKYICAPP